MQIDVLYYSPFSSSSFSFPWPVSSSQPQVALVSADARGALVLISITSCSTEGVVVRLERFGALSLSSRSFFALLIIWDKLVLGFAGMTGASTYPSTRLFNVLDWKLLRVFLGIF